MVEMVKFPYNSKSIARIDSDNIVHNHLYHNCPVGKVDSDNLVYDVEGNIVGKVDNSGNVYSSNLPNDVFGKVQENGFVSNNESLVGRVDPNNLVAGAAYLLLVHNSR